jgi:xylulokinase
MTELAREAPRGCEGVLFLPYLSGERTPHFDAAARGVFSGLSLKHGLGHLVRAVMEGVAFGLKDSVRLMRACGAAIEEVYFSGGGARSELWAKIVASVLGLPLKRLMVDEGPSFGAAVLALIAGGAFADVDEVAEVALRPKGETSPDPDLTAVYEDAYERFCQLYRRLQIGGP